MADDSDNPSAAPAAEEIAPAADSSASDAENKAQDPSSSSSPSTETGVEGDTAGAENNGRPETMTDDFSSMAVSSDVGEDPPPPPPEEPSQQQQGQVAQALPLNLPGANIGELDDAAAAAALDNEFLSLLPPCILPRIDRLKSLDERRDALLDEYRRERAALEMKYGAIIKPLYEERRGVVMGEFDGAIGEEAKKKKEEDEGGDEVAKEGVVEDVEEEDAAGVGGQEVKGIPQFWACAMGHVDVIAELITESDVDCLDHLIDITCHDFPDGLGFELHFHFSPNNPFFTNTTLTKRYEVPNLLTEDEPILKNVTGCTIDWKAGQSLTYREVKKKQRKKGGPNAGQIRTMTKRERTESFFHFFTPPKMPAFSEVMDEEEADEVEDAFDHDYDVAQAFRGHLVPKAVLWFTGEAMILDEEYEEELLAEEGAGGGSAEGGGGGQHQFTFNGGDNPFPPPAAGDGENPECKQN